VSPTDSQSARPSGLVSPSPPGRRPGPPDWCLPVRQALRVTTRRNSDDVSGAARTGRPSFTVSESPVFRPRSESTSRYPLHVIPRSAELSRLHVIRFTLSASRYPQSSGHGPSRASAGRNPDEPGPGPARAGGIRRPLQLGLGLGGTGGPGTPRGRRDCGDTVMPQPGLCHMGPCHMGRGLRPIRDCGGAEHALITVAAAWEGAWGMPEPQGAIRDTGRGRGKGRDAVCATRAEEETQSVRHGRRKRRSLCDTGGGRDTFCVTRAEEETQSVRHGRRMRHSLCDTGEGRDTAIVTRAGEETQSVLINRAEEET
jgi:hypothetical protein